MLPIPNLSAYLLIANLLVVGGWAFDHQYQKARYLQLRSDYQQLAINAEIAANETEAKWRKQIEESQSAYSEREKRLQADASAATAANNGLRGTIAEIKRSLPTNTAETNRDTADTAAELLGACGEEYRAMAESADRHAIEAATLNEAWPTEEPK